MADTSFEALKEEYRKLWASMVISKPNSVGALAKAAFADKGRYLIVEKKTGVPWYVVAALHNREASRNWKTQLAQGDLLTKVSVHVPKKRGPFETWEDGAYDALVVLKGLNKIVDWQDPARICYECERYNGFGYRNYHPNVKTPYLWSFSGHYTSGKYIADGKFSNAAIDQQCGTIPLIKRLMEMDAETSTPALVEPQPTPAELPREVTTPVTEPAKEPSAFDRFKAWWLRVVY